MLRVRNRAQNLVKSVQSFNSGISEKGNQALVKLENKVQGTIAEKWLKYWKSVCKDYKDVAVDVYTDITTKPSKAVCLGTTLAALTYCAKHNPNEQDYRDAYLHASNQLLLVHPSLQRKESASHLSFVEKNYNINCIRRFSFIIGSIMWIDRYGPECNVYDAQCTHLQVQYSKIRSRIIDIGFLDTWWILREKMVDFDVNY